MSACLFANLSFFICFDILRISETAVSDSDFYLLLKFYEKSILLTFKEKIIELFAQNEQVSMTKKVENNTGVSDVEFTITPSVLSSLILDAECFIHKDKLFFTSESITYVVGL